jgi:hypothetical protein
MSSPKAAAKSAVFIGVHNVMVDALAPQYERTVTASDSPTYPKRHGTPGEWREVVLAIIAESDSGERPVVAEALVLAATGARCTVYVNTMALGVRAAQDAGKMWEQYPTVASAEGWAQFVSIARSMGAVIVNL